MRKSFAACVALACSIGLAAAIAAPVASAATWTLRQLPPAYVDENSTPVSALLSGVSCPSESLCVAVGSLDTLALFGASCPTTSLCALVGSDGRIFTSADPFSAPAGPGGAERTTRNAPRRPRTFLFPTDDFWFVTHTRRRHVRASFRFYSPTKVRGFECRRGRRPYRRCHSPLRYWVPRGRHVLRVRAIGPTGLRGRPAIKHFRVVAARRAQPVR